jgi:hypothetical protein
VVFRDRLNLATLYRLSASRLRVELLEALFPDGIDQPPRLADPARQAYTLNSLALGYQFSGRPGAAIAFYRRNIDLRDASASPRTVAIGLENVADALRLAGVLRESEAAARRALGIVESWATASGRASACTCLALPWRLAARLRIPAVRWKELCASLRRGACASVEGRRQRYLAQRALWLGDANTARQSADRAWELANEQRYERDFIRAARLQGEAALALGDLPLADERLHHALTRARAVDFAEEELPALTALAELHRRQGNPDAAANCSTKSGNPPSAAPIPSSTPMP